MLYNSPSCCSLFANLRAHACLISESLVVEGYHLRLTFVSYNWPSGRIPSSWTFSFLLLRISFQLRVARDIMQQKSFRHLDKISSLVRRLLSIIYESPFL